MGSTRAFTARVAHCCATCDRPTVNVDTTTAILPGHRYLRHVAFPGEDGFEDATRIWVAAECATCAIERDLDVATTYGICGSYCCGTEPCVLPFVKGAPGHDCVCKRCMNDRRELVTTADGSNPGGE